MPVIQSLAAAGGFMWAGLGVTAMIFVILAIILSIFWIWMLIDCLSSSLPSTEKLIWFLVILFLHVLGAALYYVIARPGGRARMI